MNSVFADTAFYVVLLGTRDTFHRAAADFLASYEGYTTTTEYVLVEVANFCRDAGKRPAFAGLVRGLRSSARTTVIPSASDLFERGLIMFASRDDKEWSLTDCISFVVMHEHGLTQALATDRHFGQAGFETLLIRSPE
jgi:predicted nucleic acid-binding protein